MNEHRDLWWEFPTMARAQVAHLQLPGPFTSDHGG
jgi:hypothetical protein